MHNFPFDYYTQKDMLCNYNLVNVLEKNSLHNVGLFRRLCGCFRSKGWGQLGAEYIEAFQSSPPTPQQMFDVTGLPAEMFPLSKPFDEGYDVSQIDSWEKYMTVRGYSMNNLAPLVLEVPLTIWHIINKFYMPTAPKLKNGGISM